MARAKTADMVVETARTYLGTPFRHQGRIKGLGVDCAGLIVGVAKELELSAFDSKDYGRVPSADKLREVLEQEMVAIQISEAKAGDVYLMSFDAEPQHLAIITDYGIIHSYSAAKKVVEHRIDDNWKRKIRGAYRFKGVK